MSLALAVGGCKYARYHTQRLISAFYKTLNWMMGRRRASPRHLLMIKTLNQTDTFKRGCQRRGERPHVICWCGGWWRFTWQCVDEGRHFLHAPLRGGGFVRGRGRGGRQGGRGRPPRSPSRPPLHPGCHGDGRILLSTIVVFILLLPSSPHVLLLLFLFFCRHRLLLSLLLPTAGAPEITRLQGEDRRVHDETTEMIDTVSASEPKRLQGFSPLNYTSQKSVVLVSTCVMTGGRQRRESHCRRRF